ncbi:FUSC family protein, partial [Streptomyces hydrogenans]
ALAPLVHPLSPFRERKARARRVLGLLDECAAEVRGLAAVAADPDASHDARLAAACWRVETAVERLTSPRTPEHAPAGRAAEPETAPHPAPAALGHVSGLERLLAALDEPLRTPPGSLLVRS